MQRFFDNTMLKEYRTCPRKYYFRHVLNWRTDNFEAALAFGSAWHKAQETIWTVRSAADLAEQAISAFLADWDVSGGPAPDDMGPDELESLGARTPYTAAEMIHEYIAARRIELEDSNLRVISVEQPFAVPLKADDPDLFYVGRWDGLMELVREGHKIGREHKTTSAYAKGGGFRLSFIDSFSPDSQIDGYLFGGRMTFGDDFKAIWVDGALVHANVHDQFRIIPVERMPQHLDAWYWQTLEGIRNIDLQTDRLGNTAADEPYMRAFPLNTNSCWDFNRPCPYLDLCKMWPNPHPKMIEERFGDGTAQGYMVDAWSPFDKLELEKIGFEK